MPVPHQHSFWWSSSPIRLSLQLHLVTSIHHEYKLHHPCPVDTEPHWSTRQHSGRLGSQAGLHSLPVTGVLLCDPEISFSQIRLRRRPDLSSQIWPYPAPAGFEKVKSCETLPDILQEAPQASRITLLVATTSAKPGHESWPNLHYQSNLRRRCGLRREDRGRDPSPRLGMRQRQ